MPRLVLHAGLPKTGTTSIQRFLDENSGALSEQGIFYSPTPDRPGRRDHNFLAMATWQQVQRIYADRYGTDIERLRSDSLAAWDDMLDRFRASGHETLLVSGEFFARSPVKPVIEFAKEALAEFDITVVFYLRQPSAHYVSWLQQHIKGSNDLLPFGRRRSTWSKKLRLWGRVGDVEIREFNRASMVNGDVVDDFAALVGADVSLLSRPANMNESISAEGMDLLVRHRRAMFPDAPERIMPETLRLMQRIRRRERGLDDELIVPSPRLHEHLAAYLDSDVDELEKLDRLFGFRYAHIGDPATIEPVEAPGLEGKVFDEIADLIPIDVQRRDHLQRQLELAGVQFGRS